MAEKCVFYIKRTSLVFWRLCSIRTTGKANGWISLFSTCILFDSVTLSSSTFLTHKVNLPSAKKRQGSEARRSNISNLIMSASRFRTACVATSHCNNAASSAVELLADVPSEAYLMAMSKRCASGVCKAVQIRSSRSCTIAACGNFELSGGGWEGGAEFLLGVWALSVVGRVPLDRPACPCPWLRYQSESADGQSATNHFDFLLSARKENAPHCERIRFRSANCDNIIYLANI